MLALRARNSQQISSDINARKSEQNATGKIGLSIQDIRNNYMIETSNERYHFGRFDLSARARRDIEWLFCDQRIVLRKVGF